MVNIRYDVNRIFPISGMLQNKRYSLLCVDNKCSFNTVLIQGIQSFWSLYFLLDNRPASSGYNTKNNFIMTCKADNTN